MKYLTLTLLLVLGCTTTKHPIPNTTMKANGTLTTVQGTADLIIIFQPPDHFRIVARNPFTFSRILDIGGNGDIIWYQTHDSNITLKGKITVDETESFQPHPKTFTPPEK